MYRYAGVSVVLALATCLLPVGDSLAQAVADPGESVMPTAALRLSGYSAPTPLSIPGARVIDTADLRERLAGAPPLVFDTAGGTGHDTIPGAIWLPGAGLGTDFEDELQRQIAATLALASRDNTARPLVFFCVSRNCWLSYNAALRAVRLGYSEVYWYRGGLAAWRAAGGAVEPPKIIWRKPQ